MVTATCLVCAPTKTGEHKSEDNRMVNIRILIFSDSITTGLNRSVKFGLETLISSVINGAESLVYDVQTGNNL
jgi:hypothetical protein